MASVERRGESPRPQVQYRLGNRVSSGDLVFQGGRPMLVVSWRTVEWRRVPYICFPLEADKLKPSARPGIYIYDGDLAGAGKPVEGNGNR
jgi:hypothetical protein